MNKNKNIKNIPGVIISAPSSHSGKTVITCALISKFIQMGLKISAYKIGPDYIDPGFLKFASNSDVYNLDSWLMNKNNLCELFYNTSQNSDLAIIEGVMGLFDGGENSTAEIAKLLNIPVILVIDSKSAGESVAALAFGFKNYDPCLNFAGVILNNIGSENHEKNIFNALNKININIKILGTVYRDKNLILPERHMGLTQAQEINLNNLNLNLQNIKNINYDEILKISHETKQIKFTRSKIITHHKNIKIAVALDEAFSFYYAESLSTLEKFGAELIYFSPLRDKNLPAGINAIILGGGYPELHAKYLFENFSMRKNIFNCGLPIYAECGGFMYLCESLTDFDNNKFEMAGLINFDCVMNKRPVIGYVECEALNNNLICNAGKKIRGHEFHFSSMSTHVNINKDRYTAFKILRRNSEISYYGGYSNNNILASYVHINFFGNYDLAETFINRL